MAKKIPEDYMSAKEAAERWRVADSEIYEYLNLYKDKIGAYKTGSWNNSPWAIPREAKRPIFKSDLVRFAQSFLRQKDNPREVFPYANLKTLLDFMCDQDYLHCSEPKEPLEISSYCLTDDGYNLAFNNKLREGAPRVQRDTLFNIDFSLVRVL